MESEKKTGIDDLTYKAETETETREQDMDTKGERRGMGWTGRLGLTYIYYWHCV